MSDEDIKKALEEFQNRILKTNLSYHIFESEMMAVVNALDLINRQQAEIERLNGNLFTISNACMQRRNEAIKEFAERLKAKVDPNWDNSVDVEDIDNLLAEMVGE